MGLLKIPGTMVKTNIFIETTIYEIPKRPGGIYFISCLEFTILIYT